jgi:hypothetical protein
VLKLIGTVGRDTFYVSATGILFVRTTFASGNKSKLRSAGQYGKIYSSDEASQFVAEKAS